MSNEMICLPLHLVKTACHGFVQEQAHALNEIRALLAQHAEPVVSPGDEEFSHLSTIELRGYHKGWAAASAAQLAEIKRLKGLQPEGPPRPPEGEGLPRYGLRWNGPQQPLAVPMDDGYWTPWHLAALHQPDQALCRFYDVTDYPSLVRELVGHVGLLQDSAKRNVKPWEDTFPPTLLPAYIERVKAANASAHQAPVSAQLPPPNNRGGHVSDT